MIREKVTRISERGRQQAHCCQDIGGDIDMRCVEVIVHGDHPRKVVVERSQAPQAIDAQLAIGSWKV